MKKIIGTMLLASPIFLIFLIVAKDHGFIVAAATLGVVAIMCLAIVAGMKLMDL